MNNRRLKAIIVVLGVWGAVSLFHYQPQTQWLIGILTIILTVQAVRMLIALPNFTPLNETYSPTVTILIPAKNESAVLATLINNIFNLDYPALLDVWVIDDASTDKTPECLKELQTQFPKLQVLRRESSIGGKSGALNAVLPMTQGEIVVVCDADAQIPTNFLRQTVGVFENNAVGAVQVRKTIINRDVNFLTLCQDWEMSGDAWLQTHRFAVGGMNELRGSGMFVRRHVLEKCNGWNEDSITDDLDLVFRIYLVGTDIEFITAPTIQDEGVLNVRQLWHQRYRWSLGGYQRYLDYFPEFLTLGWNKQIDLFLFLILQFIVPIGLIPDLLWTVFYSHHPVLLPLQTLLGIIITFCFMGGLYKFQNLRGLSLLWATLVGSLYMLHWILVMIVTTSSLCVKPQQLNWVKTEHYGNDTKTLVL
ncbi:MAG: glycosyltransferase family 2 protein [Calothrix sp. C42_A2020_038]|nr:glycosyltransferase family 2 protein [Calothrix sp. C42_A2020_038]